MGNTLSFSVTPSEQRRVSLIEAMSGLHADPRGRADAIMVIFFTAAYAFDLVAVAYMLANRNYPPIRCKSPILMAGALVSSILWFVGDIQSKGHVPLKDTPWNNCKAFGMWIGALLGVYALGALVAVRALGLIRVFIMGRPFRGRGLYLVLLAYAVSLLVYGAAVQALPAKKTMYYVDVADVCDFSKGLQAAVFAVLGFNWLVVLVLSWHLCSIKSSFNEVFETVVGCLLVFAVLITSIVMHYVMTAYPLNATYRILNTSINHASTQIFWWTIMGVPMFNCLFRRERYLSEWTLKLLSDGLHNEYDVSGGMGSEKAPLTQQTGKGSPQAASPNARYNDAHLGTSRLEVPIADGDHSDHSGEPISWPWLTDFQQAKEPQSNRRRFQRW
ncbi:hypothetical protein IWQ57_000974 [Coemansia nantahalensis]|uniref:Uncharacterized protein n=1 Tax=Coemansia nantahalensis TaxID=2789366 RepID=A0ACC1K5Z4_9FUNG|nr:hypothetical protein IWQ57_000974 [Coemansia nantahalensis]